MHATVRRYAGNSELADKLQSENNAVTSLISNVPGFRAYYLIKAGNDTISAGKGNSVLDGGYGNDVLNGQRCRRIDRRARQ